MYDGLDRLVEAKRGSGSGTGFALSVGSQHWGLDHIGNHLSFDTDLTGNGQYTDSGDVQIAGTYTFTNEIDELTRTQGGTPVQLPFSYDDAGNMDSKALTADSSLVFTHDAWNRLVQVGRVTGTGNPIPVASYHYNGLHQRIIKRVDTSAPGTGGSGTLDQQHQFYYTAGWQIAEELVDENWSEMGPASIDKTFKYVWGVRYIDDIILRRREAEMFGAGEETWYHLTDHQFSTVALIDNSANLVERVTYDAYGAARHHWVGDINGDGAVGRNDQDMMSASQNKSIGDAEYHVDADITRTGTVDMTDADWTTTPNFKAALPKGVLSAPAVNNSIGYAGYVFNAEVPGGLYTVRFRHYDPGLGRWLERDPLGYVDGMSLYGYGFSSPLNFNDPFGLSSKKPWWKRAWGWIDDKIFKGNNWLHRQIAEKFWLRYHSHEFLLSGWATVEAWGIAVVGGPLAYFAIKLLLIELGHTTISKVVYNEMIAAIGTKAGGLARLKWLVANGHLPHVLVSILKFKWVSNILSGPTKAAWAALAAMLYAIMDWLFGGPVFGDESSCYYEDCSTGDLPGENSGGTGGGGGSSGNSGSGTSAPCEMFVIP